MNDIIRAAHRARERHRMQNWKVSLPIQETDLLVKKPLSLNKCCTRKDDVKGSQSGGFVCSSL